MKSPFSRFFGGGDKEVEPQTIVGNHHEHVQQVNIELIKPNKYQPRSIFSEEKIEELARTIHTHGVIQPIVIRPMGENGYEIIAGERRYRAMRITWLVGSSRNYCEILMIRKLHQLL